MSEKVDHAARSHALYSASGAHRWSACPAQPRYCATLPAPPPSPYAEEGTRAHEVLDICLRGAIREARYLSGTHHHFEITAAMMDAVQVVLDYVQEVGAENPSAELFLEAQAPFPQSIVPPDQCGGTVDVAIYAPETSEAWIVDFKYGEGVAVEARANPQLLFYAACMFWTRPLRKLTLTIIQPRARHAAGPIREWVIGPEELIEFQADVEEWLRRAETPDAPLIPGPHCKWCPGAATCTERERTALAVAHSDFADIGHFQQRMLPKPADLDMQRISAIVRHSAALRAWLDDVEDFAFGQALRGVHVPGCKLVEAQARRRWNGDDTAVAEAVVALSGGKLSLDEVLPRKLANITDMEAALVRLAREGLPRKAADAAAAAVRHRFAFLTVKDTSGKISLVPEHDPRPAVNRARVDFSDIGPALTVGTVPDAAEAVSGEHLAPSASTPDPGQPLPLAPGYQAVPMWPGATVYEPEPTVLTWSEGT